MPPLRRTAGALADPATRAVVEHVYDLLATQQDLLRSVTAQRDGISAWELRSLLDHAERCRRALPERIAGIADPDLRIVCSLVFELLDIHHRLLVDLERGHAAPADRAARRALSHGGDARLDGLAQRLNELDAA